MADCIIVSTSEEDKNQVFSVSTTTDIQNLHFGGEKVISQVEDSNTGNRSSVREKDEIVHIHVQESFYYINEIPGLFFLHEPLKILIKTDSDGITLINDDLEIIETGSDLQEALSEFFSYFKCDYQNWIETADDELTDKTRKIKENYIRLVG
jgi:hypothetical protein